MNSGCLGVLRNAGLVAAAAVVLTAAVGWFLGWRTALQFSDGLFWAGGIVMTLGLLSILGGQGVRANIGMLYSESAADRISDRTRKWVAGLTEDFGTILALLLGGGLLVLAAVLVGLLAGSGR